MSKLLKLFLLFSLLVSCTTEDEENPFEEKKNKKKKNPKNEEDINRPNREQNTVSVCNEPLNIKDRLNINFNYPWDLPADIEIRINDKAIYSACQVIAGSTLSWIDSTYFELDSEFKSMSLEDKYHLTLWDVTDCDSHVLVSNTPIAPVKLQMRQELVCGDSYDYQVGTINYL